MDISAPENSLADRPHWAIWVTRVLGRREERTSISCHTLADLGRNGVARSERPGGKCRFEPSIAVPGDAGQLVGEGDRQQVVMQPLPGSLDPWLEPVPFPDLLSDQHDPGRLDEEGPQVAVAALRYRAEDGAVARRHLPWDQPEPGGEVTPLGESIAACDRGYHRAGDDRTASWDAHQPFAADVPVGQKLDLARQLFDPLIEPPPVGGEILEDPRHTG